MARERRFLSAPRRRGRPRAAQRSAPAARRCGSASARRSFRKSVYPRYGPGPSRSSWVRASRSFLAVSDLSSPAVSHGLAACLTGLAQLAPQADTVRLAAQRCGTVACAAESRACAAGTTTCSQCARRTFAAHIAQNETAYGSGALAACVALPIVSQNSQPSTALSLPFSIQTSCAQVVSRIAFAFAAAPEPRPPATRTRSG
jgi:hypothetical protein